MFEIRNTSEFRAQTRPRLKKTNSKHGHVSGRKAAQTGPKTRPKKQRPDAPKNEPKTCTKNERRNQP
jgi:hypothetical protein